MADSLSEQDRLLLLRATELFRPLARAARIARTNGGWLAAFGAISLLIGAFEPDWLAFVLGGFTIGVGLAERRAGLRLRDAVPDATRQLARNELILMAGIVLYSALKLCFFRPSGAALEAALRDVMPDIDVQAMLDSTTNAFYGIVIAVSILYQGGMALYFTRRKSAVVQFNTEIPEWARELVRGMSGSMP